jgi:bis(5'-nucleosyl)-tetraphosphatase (symmetrical)
MATYAIGDVQGCRDALQRLLDHIRFDPSGDRLWFVGDLVNRGPDSLGVLRYIRSLGSSARIVLGNHDLFLLAASEGVVALRPKDTIDDVLKADDRLGLIDWLRHQPLHHREGPFFMVHAGLLPQWTTLDAARLASEVETALRAEDFRSFLQSLFHEPVITWSPHLTGAPRLVSIARVLTGLRTCTLVRLKRHHRVIFLGSVFPLAAVSVRQSSPGIGRRSDFTWSLICWPSTAAVYGGGN